MQGGLADPDGRVGPDRREPHVVGHLVGGEGPHPAQAEGARVGLGQGHRPLVDVDRPHRRVGREKAEGEGDRPPAAPEVEQVAFRWRRRHLSQQHGRALVQAFGAEDAGRSPHGHGPAGQRQVQSALLAGAGRARRE